MSTKGNGHPITNELLFSLLGIILGALFTLLPTSLGDARSKYERLSGLYGHLYVEDTEISRECSQLSFDTHYSEGTLQTETFIPLTLAPITVSAFEIAISDADFQQDANPGHLNELVQTYHKLGVLNNALAYAEQYGGFIPIKVDAALKTRIHILYTTVNTRCDEVTNDLSDAELLAYEKQRQDETSNLASTCWWWQVGLGVFGFVALVILLGIAIGRRNHR